MFNDLLLNYSLYTVVIKYFVFTRYTRRIIVMFIAVYEQHILTKKSYFKPNN